MSGQSHLVRRQTLELAVSSREGALALQEEARAALDGEALAALEEVFDALAPVDRVLRCARIELDLGALPRAELGRVMAERIRLRLTEALQRELRGAAAAGGGAAIVPRGADDVELLRALLETGSLPWWAGAGAQSELGPLLARMADRQPDALGALLRSLPPSRVASRLALQLTAPALRRVFELLTPGDGPRLWRLAEDWAVLARAAAVAALRGRPQPGNGGAIAAVAPWDEDGTRGLQPRVCAAFLGLCLRGASSEAGTLCEELYAVLAANLASPAAEPDRALGDLARDALPGNSPLRHWLGARVARAPASSARTAAQRGAGAAAADTPGRGPQAGEMSAAVRPPEGSRHGPRAQGADEAAGCAATDEDGREAPATGSSAEPRAARATALESEAEAAEHYAETAEHYAGTAGLVLLWPFLNAFFETLGLVRDHCFLAGGARERAVLLLHYLATGESACVEPRLLLPKILCGLPPREPVPREFRPSAAEEKECRELLAAILGHWQALKGTSAEGLRASFLSRAGRLTRQEKGWGLLVARTGYDVLLDRLPWGIGFVLLPWMAAPVMVEW